MFNWTFSLIDFHLVSQLSSAFASSFHSNVHDLTLFAWLTIGLHPLPSIVYHILFDSIEFQPLNRLINGKYCVCVFCTSLMSFSRCQFNCNSSLKCLLLCALEFMPNSSSASKTDSDFDFVLFSRSVIFSFDKNFGWSFEIQHSVITVIQNQLIKFNKMVRDYIKRFIKCNVFIDRQSKSVGSLTTQFTAHFFSSFAQFRLHIKTNTKGKQHINWFNRSSGRIGSVQCVHALTRSAYLLFFISVYLIFFCALSHYYYFSFQKNIRDGNLR